MELLPDVCKHIFVPDCLTALVRVHVRLVSDLDLRRNIRNVNKKIVEHCRTTVLTVFGVSRRAARANRKHDRHRRVVLRALRLGCHHSVHKAGEEKAKRKASKKETPVRKDEQFGEGRVTSRGET